MKKQLQTQPAAGPQQTPAALLIEQMQGVTLAARLDKIEKAITRLSDSLNSHPANTTPPDYLSRKEAAELLGVTFPTLADWTNKKILRAYKIGRRIYYKPAEISAAMIQKGGVL